MSDNFITEADPTESFTEKAPVTIEVGAKARPILVHLYDDENGIRQQALHDIGIRTFAVHVARNNSHEHLRHQLLQLELQRPSLIWLRIRGPCTLRGDRHDQRRSRTGQAVVLEQLRRQGDLIVEGGSRDPAWGLRRLRCLVTGPSFASNTPSVVPEWSGGPGHRAPGTQMHLTAVHIGPSRPFQMRLC